MELSQALIYGIDNLKNVSSNPHQETKFILQDILNCDDSFFILHADEPLGKEETDQFFSIINERKMGKPLAYIQNCANFMNWEFYVNEDVLIPRFDTERSVEAIIPLLKTPHKKFLEIGVGSGAIILSLALTCPHHIYHGVDISKKALEVAEKNRDYYRLDNVQLWESNLYEEIVESYDIIFSNPPYISTREMITLDKSVKNYEPHLALHGGNDGLDFYRKIINQGIKYLNNNGILALEIGYNQKEEVRELLTSENYRDIRIINDYQGHPRVVLASKGV